MKIFIAYAIVSEIYELIHFFIGYRGFIKYKENNFWIKEFISSLLSSASMKMLVRRILNPFTILFVGIPMILILNLFIFPFSMFYLVRKLLGIKSDLQKKAEAESIAMEMSRKRHDDFMKNGGIHIGPIETQPINPN